jgi:hypothetical protein
MIVFPPVSQQQYDRLVANLFQKYARNKRQLPLAPLCNRVTSASPAMLIANSIVPLPGGCWRVAHFSEFCVKPAGG